MKKETETVAVIGAGIVGACIAYELRKRGLDVLLLDRDEPGRACSYGNSGAISSASVAPLAMPGIVRSVPGMIGKPDSPLFLPWHYLPHAVPWLLRFVLASRPGRVQESARQLADIHQNAVALHIDMAREVGRPDLILQRGHLHLYRDRAAFERDAMAWQLREAHGVQYQVLDRAGIVQLEPAVSDRYQLGVFMADQATVVNPFQYVQAIVNAFQQRGGRFQQLAVNAIAPEGTTGWRLHAGGETIRVSRVVVAAGVWTRQLLAPLGIKLSLESQRGYHVQFQGGSSPVSRTVVLTDRRVFLTPMTDGLRVGGTVEIAGLKARPDPRRAKALADIALENFEDLADQPYTSWSGHRPCMPDSVPVIGPAAKHPGLFIAAGHGHLGLTDSIGTAQRIADILGDTG